MAQISIEELLLLIKASPEYRDRLELDVPAEQALYIRFTKGAGGKVQSDVLELANGSELVLDRDPDGKIVGIEVV